MHTSKKMRRPTGALALASLLAAAGQVQAQEDTASGSGGSEALRGYKLQPGISTEAGFDSNFFQGSGVNGNILINDQFRPTNRDGTAIGDGSGSVTEPVVSSFRVRVTPSFVLKPNEARLENPRRQVDVTASVSASYNEMIATDANYSDALSKQRFLSGDVGVGLDFLPERPVNVSVGADYSRTVQPTNDPAAPPSFKMNNVGGNLGLSFEPQGRNVEFAAGYKVNATLFEESDFKGYNTIRHDMNLGGQWEFRPRTALYLDGDLGFLTFPNRSDVKSPGQSTGVALGLKGQVAPKLKLRVEGGYKGLFFDNGPDINAGVAKVDLTFAAHMAEGQTPKSSATVGYQRDAQPSFLGNYVQIDRVFVRGDYDILSFVEVGGELAFDHLNRPRSEFADGSLQTEAFSENRMRATLSAEYRATRRLGITTKFSYFGALTDRKVALSPTALEGTQTLAYDDLSFDRFQAWTGLNWTL